MKIRITGTADETAAAAELLKDTFDVQEISAFYPNRGDSTLGRVYVEAQPKPPGTVVFVVAGEEMGVLFAARTHLRAKDWIATDGSDYSDGMSVTAIEVDHG